MHNIGACNIKELYNAPIRGMSYLNKYLGLIGGKARGIDMIVLMEQVPMPGAQSCIASP